MKLPTTRDPIYNRNINPIYNRNINPIYNRNINPIYNRNINPIYNRNINPIYNRNINPIYNRNIDPTYNQNFEGIFFFDLTNIVIEFAIIRDEILFVFNFDNALVKFGVKHIMNGFVLFDIVDNSTIGHLENNSDTGYNLFDSSNKWVAYGH